MSFGVKKAKKFKIGTDGNPAYEALINSPLVRVTSQDSFTNYGDYYLVVHYQDMGYEPEEGLDGGDESSDSGGRGGNGGADEA